MRNTRLDQFDIGMRKKIKEVIKVLKLKPHDSPVNNVVGSLLWYVGLTIIVLTFLTFFGFISFTPSLKVLIFIGCFIFGLLFLGFAEVIFLFTQIVNRDRSQ